MVVNVAPPRSRAAASGGRYGRAWSAVTLVAASAWVAVAVLQTPRLPLFLLVGLLAAVGGTLFVRAPAASALGRRQYVGGALGVAGLVLVTVGIGHHPEAGLATVSLLSVSSPGVIRWVGRGS